MDDPRPDPKDFSLEALRKRFAEQGLEPYRAEQVAGWIYGRGVEDPARMTDLGRDLRRRLADEWRFERLELAELLRARDGTQKARLRCRDGAEVEAVLIPEPGRTTLCVSTQVGCSLACSFCATGSMGLLRNLRTGEIVDQLLRMRELLPAERSITNVVFMGMGEPLLNLAAVVEAIRILVHPKALGYPGRRVTVSTAGVVPQLRPLLAAVRVNLAVSLHASDDAVRDQLVPLNRRFPLGSLLQELAALPQLTPRWPVFFEYTLIDGVNDGAADARRLVPLLRGLSCKLNVIPLNPHPGSPHRPSPPERAEAFVAEVARAGLTVTVRRSRGADIAAACGQLGARPAHAAA